jgi:PPP family 3-phenylpropionic acid transporter
MKKNVTLYYGVIMAVYSLGFVTMSAFSSVYLLSVGISSGEIGILLAIGGIISALLQPVAGVLVDRHPKVSCKTVLFICSIIIAFFGLLLLLIQNKSVWITGILYGVPIMLLYLAQPFLNALGMEAINLGYELNFGIGKAMGSTGYAAASYVFGIISVKIGPHIVPTAFAIVFLVLTAIVFFYPVGKSADLKNPTARPKLDNPYLFLTRYKRLAIVFLGLMFIYFSHTLINTFSLQIVLPKGGTSADMGTAAAIAAVCELITMLMFSIYARKFGITGLLKVSGVFFTLKTLFSMTTKTVNGFFAIQVLQMFGWGLLAIGIVYYVNEHTGDEDKAQGQAYAGIAMTAGNVIATFIGGILIDVFGVNMMLIVGTLVSALGTVILWIFLD